MARIVTHTAVGPSQVVTENGDVVWVCCCGLGSNEDGTCTGNHNKADVASENPDKLYRYDCNLRRKEVKSVKNKD